MQNQEEDDEQDHDPYIPEPEELAFYKEVSIPRIKLERKIQDLEGQLVSAWFEIAKLHSKGNRDQGFALSASWLQVLQYAHGGLPAESDQSNPAQLKNGAELLNAICRAYTFAVLKNSSVELKIKIEPSGQFGIPETEPQEPWLIGAIVLPELYSTVMLCWWTDWNDKLKSGSRPAKPQHFRKCLWCLRKLETKTKKFCSDNCKSRYKDFSDACISELKGQLDLLKKGLPFSDQPQERVCKRLKELAETEKIRQQINDLRLRTLATIQVEQFMKTQHRESLMKEFDNFAESLKKLGLDQEAEILQKEIQMLLKN